MLEEATQFLDSVMKAGLAIARQMTPGTDFDRPSPVELMTESWLRVAAQCGSLEARVGDSGTLAESGFVLTLGGQVCCVYSPSTGFPNLTLRTFLAQIALRVEEHLYRSMDLFQLPASVQPEDIQHARRSLLSEKARRDDGRPEDWCLLEQLAGEGRLQLTQAKHPVSGSEWDKIDFDRLGVLFGGARLEPSGMLQCVDPLLLAQVSHLLISSWEKSQKDIYALNGGPYVSLYGYTGSFPYMARDESPVEMFVELSNGSGPNYDEIIASGKPIYYALIRRMDFAPPIFPA